MSKKKTKEAEAIRAQEIRRALRIVIEDILVDELGLNEQDIADAAQSLPGEAAPDVSQDDPVEYPDEADQGVTDEPEVTDPSGDMSFAEYAIIGDDRRLKAYALSTDGGASETQVGEAWQDIDGDLHGTGIFLVMLFEPLSNAMYRESSIGLDSSPLAVLAMRLARSPFVRIEWEIE